MMTSLIPVDYDSPMGAASAAPNLIPVDYDPFPDTAAATVVSTNLVPVDHNPFGGAGSAGSAVTNLVPVDYHPFADSGPAATGLALVDNKPVARSAVAPTNLIPVNHLPFGDAAPAATNLVPIDHDPVWGAAAAATNLVPIDYDPFAALTSTGGAGIPASGADGSPAGSDTTASSVNSTAASDFAHAGTPLAGGPLGRILGAFNPIGYAQAADVPETPATVGSVLRAAIASGRITEKEAAALQQRVNSLSPAERLGPVIRATLPKFDEKTYGVLVTNEGKIVEFKSGGGRDLPYGNYPIASHAEGKAAAWIRDNGSSGGVLYHNNPGGTCGYCRIQAKFLLPEGVELRIVPPEGAARPTDHD
jgi:hypothetical protein